MAEEKTPLTPEEIEQITKQYEELKKLDIAQQDATKSAIELAAAEAKFAEKQRDVIAALDSHRTVLSQFKNLNEKIANIKEKDDEETKKQIANLKEQALALKDAAAEADEYVNKIEKLGPGYENALRNAGPMFEDIATTMGLASKKGNELAESIGSIAFQKGGIRGLGKVFVSNFLNPVSIGISLLTKLVEQTISQAFAVDKAGAAYTKATGMSRQYDGMINQISQSQREFGIEAEQVQKSLVSLSTTLSQFNDLPKETARNLVKVVSQLEGIGVAAEDSVQMITKLNKAFGTSEDVAANLTKEMALSGEAIGMSSQQIVREFNSALGTLAIYGPRSTKIFKDIATMAKAAGVEVNDMLGIANQFDTFSSSAKTAAKMNAILGTSFSGVNLMMMDHDEKLRHIIGGMQRSGVAFKNLDKFTQQAVAAQLGIKDMGKANQMLGMTLGEYDRMKSKQQAVNKTQEELEKRLKATLPAMQRMELAFKEFAISMEPLIPTFIKIIEFLAGVAKYAADNPWKSLAMGVGAFMLKAKFAAAAQAKALVAVGQGAGGAAPGVSKLATASKGLLIGFVPATLAIAGLIYALSNFMKVMFDSIIIMKMYGVGWKDIAKGLGTFAASIVVLTGVLWALDKVATKLARNPLGMAITGIVAATAGLAMGIGASGSAPVGPELDTNMLMENADAIDGLATRMQSLVKSKGNIKATFAAIGEGLEQSKEALNADIQSTIANIALITTGKAAGDMNMTVSALALSTNELIDTIGTYLGATNDKEKVTYLKLDKKETAKLWKGEKAKAEQSSDR